jgi:hypothetical protein
MRSRQVPLAFFFVCATFVATAAAAQDSGQVGLTMGYPAAVGVIYHVTDHLAVRPEFTASRASTDSSSPLVRNGTTWSLGVGVSGLFYVSKWDNLRAYVSPRFTYSHDKNSIESEVLIPIGQPAGQTIVVESTGKAYSLSGSFGVQYSLSHKFGIFGETGLAYTHTILDDAVGTTIKSDGWGSRTGAGVIFYF